MSESDTKDVLALAAEIRALPTGDWRGGAAEEAEAILAGDWWRRLVSERATLRERVEALEAELAKTNAAWDADLLERERLFDEAEQIRKERDRLANALEELVTWQNGSPLVMYEKQWEAAMLSFALASNPLSDRLRLM